MENQRLLFLLFYIVSIIKIVISIEIVPNSEENTAQSDLELVNGKSKRLTLRSVDPLTIRSPFEKNFIRFGRRDHTFENNNVNNFRHPILQPLNMPTNRRMLNKRETYNYENNQLVSEAVKDSTLSDPELSSLALNIMDNIQCIVPSKQENQEYLLCMSPNKNNTGRFYVIIENPNNGDTDDETDDEDDEQTTNKTTLSIRYPVSIPIIDDSFPRSSRSSKFPRNIFSRYDRGGDNFLRFGRASLFASSKRKQHDNFMRLGRDNYSKFMRLGRNSPTNYKFSHPPYLGRQKTDDDLKRPFRKYDDKFGYSDVEDNNSKHNRYFKKNNNYLRLGRSYTQFGAGSGRTFVPIYSNNLNHRQADDTLAIGEIINNLVSSDAEPKPRNYWTKMYDRDLDKRGKAENYMRLGRTIEAKNENSIEPSKLLSDVDDNRIENQRLFRKLDSNDAAGDNHQRSQRKFDNFMQFARSTDSNNLCLFIASYPDFVFRYFGQYSKTNDNYVSHQDRLWFRLVQDCYDRFINVSETNDQYFDNSVILQKLKDLKNLMKKMKFAVEESDPVVSV